MKFIQDWGTLITVILAVIAGVYKFAILEQKVSDTGILAEKHKAIAEIKKQREDSVAGFHNGVNTLPIGTIVAYWGAISDIDKLANYEICDGTKVTTQNSNLLGQKKPNLLGRFPRGAERGTLDVSKKPIFGGQDELPPINTSMTTLSVAQMPVHTHVLVDPGHSHNSTENINNAGGIYDKGTARQAASYYGAPNRRTSSDKTSITMKNSGENKGHNHNVSAQDNRPAFQTVFYIIKVR